MIRRLFTLAIITLLAGGFSAFAANPLEALSGIISGLTSTDKFEVSSLEGTWNFQSPAVSFKSDNALNKIGGVAASATIESKLSAYYKKLGINNAVFTFDKEGNFTLKLKKVTLTGTVTKEDDKGALTFNFKAHGKIGIGKVSAQATKSVDNVLTITFDASRVISIVNTVASLSGNSSLKSLSTILNTYDGIYAGAKFKKK